MMQGNQECIISLDLKNNVQLRVLISDVPGFLTLHYSHRRAVSKDGSIDVDLFHNQQTYVHYENGELTQEFALMVELIRPKKRGKLYAYGVDISPGSKATLFFYYQRREHDYTFVLSRVESGLKVQHVNPENKEGLILPVPINLPFPILDRIPLEGGRYRIPFIDQSGEESCFLIPASVRRYPQSWWKLDSPEKKENDYEEYEEDDVDCDDVDEIIPEDFDLDDDEIIPEDDLRRLRNPED